MISIYYWLCFVAMMTRGIEYGEVIDIWLKVLIYIGVVMGGTGQVCRAQLLLSGNINAIVQRSLAAGAVAQLRCTVARVGTHYPCYFIKYQQKHFQFRPQNTQVTMTIICNSLPIT